MSRWSFRGTALDDLGIVTMVSDSLMMPEKRGDNILIPFQDGRLHVTKFFEQRSMAIGLEIVEETRAALESKMDTVKALFGSRSLGSLVQTLEDLSVRSLQVEYAGSLDLTPVSPVSVKMVLEFIAPDPYFRGSTLLSEIQVIDANPKTFTINNPGTADERNPKIILTGPLDHVTITNTTNSVSISYNAAIDAPRIVTIEKTGRDYVVTDDLGANMIGNISHAGSEALFVLNAGDNDMSVVDAVATTGSVALEFYPPYL